MSKEREGREHEETMRRDPSDEFQSPQQVLDAADLSRDDKIRILTGWAYDLRELQVAEEENMRGAPGLAGRLAAVEQALLTLGVEDVRHDSKA